MPTDAYLNTFETNPIAAVAFYWARFWSWKFCWLRHAGDAEVRAGLVAEDAAAARERVRVLRGVGAGAGGAMDVDDGAAGGGADIPPIDRHLKDAGGRSSWREPMDVDAAAPHLCSLRAAIAEESLVTDADVERCTRLYYARMNPAVPVSVCAVCCNYDVPIVDLPPSATSPGVTAKPVQHVMAFVAYADVDTHPNLGASHSRPVVRPQQSPQCRALLQAVHAAAPSRERYAPHAASQHTVPWAALIATIA